MKAPYEELEFEVIRFTVEDIITTSNAQTDDDDKDQDTDKDQDDQGGNEDDGGNDDYTYWGSGTLQMGTEASSSAGIYVKTVDGTEQYFVKQGDTYVRVHQGEDGIWYRDA